MISASQFDRRHAALSVSCKKVYAAVPISEPWATSYILSEVQRLGTFASSMSVLLGSLNQLKASGMVAEPSPGLFIRTPIKAVSVKSEPHQQPTEELPVITTKPDKPVRTPLTVIADLAARAKQLTDDIETAALEIDEYVAAAGADSAKLKQLQALLKGA